MSTDIFKPTPAQGAVLRDWTHRTLTVDIENSLGEAFHFEIEPGEGLGNLPPASHSDNIATKVIMPIASA